MSKRRASHVYVVMDTPPGPLSQFIEVEGADGKSLPAHKWIQEGDKWLLEIPSPEVYHSVDVGE